MLFGWSLAIADAPVSALRYGKVRILGEGKYTSVKKTDDLMVKDSANHIQQRRLQVNENNMKYVSVYWVQVFSI